MIADTINTVDQHIAQTERHIAGQIELIEQLSATGCDAKHSRELLCLFQDTLHMLKRYRYLLEGQEIKQDVHISLE